ncbi:MAG: Crp/Fnr family transcriptional regulator [Anaerolineae bacterium]|nr:Crp/Fnr family transcriptional regulator [Anaerolineae bacterium]
MDVVARTLSEFRILADLDRAALRDIAAYVSESTYDPNQIIALAGEPCRGVYMIVQGEVRVRRLSLEGREYVLDYLGPGECFNIVPVLDGGTSLATTEAASRAVLYVIPCDRFLGLVQAHRQVAMAVTRYLAERVRYLSDAVEGLALHTVRTRLARFLLAQADDPTDEGRRWTQEEIAAHVGTVRDVVGRTLRNFSREGMIRHAGGPMVVADRRALEREAMQEEMGG